MSQQTPAGNADPRCAELTSKHRHLHKAAPYVTYSRLSWYQIGLVSLHMCCLCDMVTASFFQWQAKGVRQTYITKAVQVQTGRPTCYKED